MIRARSSMLGGFATAAVIAAVAAAPAPAAVSGTTTLVLSGPAAKALRADGVRIGPVKPAKGSGQRIALPVRAGLAGSQVTVLTHGGGISFQYRGATARLTKLRLVLGKRSRLSAKLGGRSVDVFAVPGSASRAADPAAGTVQLGGSRLKLTRAGAKAIAARLNRVSGRKALRRTRGGPPLEVRQGHFGGLSARAAGLAAAGAAPPLDGDAVASTSCPLPSGAGPAPDDPLPPAPSPPAGAVGVSSATLGWHVRESFIRYIATGEGTSALDGATADPPVLLPGASTSLSYDFRFPFANDGWHHSGADPADPADDSAAIRFGGALRFLYSGHGIDLKTAQPEIEIAGGASRAVFTVTDGADPTKRQVLVNLDLSRAGAIGASGSTVTYERIPAAIPSGTATSVFGGFYTPGAEFGCFTLSYTTS